MKDFIAFDLETTGLSNDDEIIEIGLVKIRNGKIKESFSSLIKPTKKISKEIKNLTGISQELLDNSLSINEVIDDIKNFIGNDLLIGHNVEFDIKYIKKYIDLENEYIDTLKLAQIFYPFSHKHSLGNLAKYLGIETNVEHRALEDALTTAKVMLKMSDDIKCIDFKTLYNIQDTLPESAERNYIKELMKEAKGEGIYNYKIPSNYFFYPKINKILSLKDDLQKEIFENILKYDIYLLEIFTLSDLKDYVFLPVLKFAKENKEKFFVVKSEKEDISEYFDKLRHLSDENDLGINAVFIKNKENYLCLKRYNLVITNGDIEPFKLASLKFWITKTQTGDLSEIIKILKNDAIKLSVNDSCKGKECEFFDKCFYFRIKEKENDADIIITDYNNFFRNEYEYRNVVFLDADNIEEIATQAFSLNINFKEIEYILREIIRKLQKNKDDIKGDFKLIEEKFILMVNDIKQNIDKFKNGILFSEYEERFIEIYDILNEIKEKIKETELVYYLNTLIEKFDKLLKFSSDYVLKINVKEQDILYSTYTFFPITIWNMMEKKISNLRKCIFLAKALTTSCDFNHFMMITGIDKIKKEVKKDSHIISSDEMKRFRIFLVDFLPPFNSDKFKEEISIMLKDVFKRFKKSYIMFTSYSDADKVYELIEDEDYVFLKHERNKQLKNILGDNEEYVVLGTMHLFNTVKEKFDILVIPKIPFPNMKDEVINKRIQAIKEYDYDSFDFYLLPIAIKNLKKSILKLIDLCSEKCAIIILDKRLIEKEYSNAIIDSFFIETEKVMSSEELKERLNKFFDE